MASINASTSGAGGVITTADNTGTLQLQSGGTTIATISSTGITTQVGAPAFSAFMSASQTVTTSIWTKANFNTEEFDTGNCYNNSTYDFTPTAAGYYQVNIHFTFGGTAPTGAGMALYKNGSPYKYLALLGPSFNNGGISQNSCLVYLNGSTDYISAYGYCAASGTATLSGGVQQSSFQAFLARSA